MCPNCSKENSPEVLYCAFCGKLIQAEKAANICLKCNYKNAIGAIYCGKCGIKLEESESGNKTKSKNK